MNTFNKTLKRAVQAARFFVPAALWTGFPPLRDHRHETAIPIPVRCHHRDLPWNKEKTETFEP